MYIKQPNVAIVIPTLNEEDFIQECLNSVFSQTYPLEKMDIMVIDGGSFDKTIEIVEEILSTHSNVRLLHNPKKIQSIAFNIGVSLSNAPIVVRLDAHAKYDAHYVELCVKHIVGNKDYGNVGGKWSIYPSQNTLIAHANALLNQSRFGIGGASYRIGNKAKEVDTVPFGAFPRKVLNVVGTMSEQLVRGEDNEYNYRIQKKGYKIFFDPEIKCTYYSRSTIKASIRQMYGNGVSIGKLFFLNPKILSLRHFIPFVFFMCLILLSILSFFSVYFLYSLLGLLVVYLLVDILFSINIAYKHNWKLFFVLPILFFAVHIAYGYGTLIGMLR